MGLIEQAKREGAYQPIIIGGKKVTSGWRECEQRWDWIKPYIPANATILDIGSHYGFFTLKAAEYAPDSFIWSIEENAERADIQRQMLEANKLNNVILSQHKWTLDTTEKLLSTCFTADVIMLLSVGHYFDRATMPQMFQNLASLAPTLIIEWPSKEEIEVAGKDLIQNTDIGKLLGDNYAHVEVIGKGRSPKHKEINREIYRASNDTIYMATNEHFGRPKAKSYIGGSESRWHDVEYYEGKWHIDQVRRQFPGMTLDDLRHFGMIFPDRRVALYTAAMAYKDLIDYRRGKVTDIHIRNVLMKPEGLQLIDTIEGLDRKFIYDMPMADYIKRTLSWDSQEILRQFNEMWKGEWKP